MFAVLYIPQFSLQAVLRYEADKWSRPVALVDPTSATPRVLEATQAAREQGVVDGATAPQALARCPNLLIRHHSPALEALLTAAVLQSAYGFSPHLESTAPGVITLDLRGLSEGREVEVSGCPGQALGAWGQRVAQAMGAMLIQVRVGTGPTPSVARYAAQWGRVESPGVMTGGAGKVSVVLDPGRFMAGLPIEALGPSSDVLGLLHRWGIRSVGELVALGQGELADRLGLEALALFAAASVTANRPLNLEQPAETFAEQHPFEPPVETVEPVLFLLRRFTDSLGQRLESCGLAARALRLHLGLEGGGVVQRRINLPQATRRSGALFRILQTQLETVRTDQPVVEVGLVVEPARPEERQFLLFEATLKDPLQFQETLARLAALLGPDRVGTPRRQDAHRPDSFVLEPPDFDRRASRLDTVERVPDRLRRIPMRRFRPALPATVELSAGAMVDSGAGAPGRAPEAVPGGLNSPEANLAPNIISWLEPVLRPGSGSPPDQPRLEPDPPVVNGAPANGPRSQPSFSSPPANAQSEKESCLRGRWSARPVRVECGQVGGGIEEVMGPWRSSGHWWEAPVWQREEWHVATRARVVLQLALEEGQWRVEGILD